MHPALAHYRIIAATLGHRRPKVQAPAAVAAGPWTPAAHGDSCNHWQPKVQWATAAGDSCRRQLRATAAGSLPAAVAAISGPRRLPSCLRQGHLGHSSCRCLHSSRRLGWGRYPPLSINTKWQKISTIFCNLEQISGNKVLKFCTLVQNFD